MEADAFGADPVDTTGVGLLLVDASEALGALALRHARGDDVTADLRLWARRIDAAVVMLDRAP